MLYAEYALPVDAEIRLVRMRQSSHAGLHARHEVSPRHPWCVTLETDKRLRGLGKVDFTRARKYDRAFEHMQRYRSCKTVALGVGGLSRVFLLLVACKGQLLPSSSGWLARCTSKATQGQKGDKAETGVCVYTSQTHTK